MGFKQVYSTLLDVFPQIDSRLLRAVAIEHSKDADAACETVLLEILPTFTLRSTSGSPLSQSLYEAQSTEDVLAQIQTTENPAEGQNSQDAFTHPEVESSDKTSVLVLSGDNLDASHHEGESSNNTSVSLEDLENSVQDKLENLESINKTFVSVLSEENLENSAQEKTDTQSHGGFTELVKTDGQTLQDEDIGAEQNMNLVHGKVDCGDSETKSLTGLVLLDPVETDDVPLLVVPDMHGGGKVDCGDSETKSLTGPVLLDPVETDDVPLLVVPDMHGGDVEVLEKSFSSTNSVVGTEDELSTLSMSQSSQIPHMEVLEELIADAGNKKKTLFSGLVSVVSLVKHVEQREQDVEQAKQEVTKAGAEKLADLEVLKQQIQKTKESNSMHAGEVYGEKAILATELRELQSRVLSLADERDESLTVLDEMRRTLEVRLAAAENEIKSTEQEKLEKEKAAKKAFADHELIMDELVQESKILRQQAEENAKLQEFLMDRGRVVDMLQGEIAVVCKDVRLLKESFDDNIPFSKSLSSSQTSCILASSTSSSKNLNPEELVTMPGGANPLVMTRTEVDTPAVTHKIEQFFEGESTAADYRKELVDDGWEFFDNREDVV